MRGDDRVVGAKGHAMSYRLGVDLGTTYTAAAVAEGDAAPVVLELGQRAAQIPSVVFVAADGAVLVGEAAERRAAAEPARLVREFKRRLGDHVPLLVAGAAHSPESLGAHLLRWVVQTATARQGSAPDEIVLTHPATWGGYRLEVFDQLVALAEVGPVRRCTEPEAAAAQYAAHTAVGVGERLAVYDLGGGTFDTCVLEKTVDGFDLLGRPEGLDHLGGVDFDEVVFQQVVASASARFDALDPEDPELDAALVRLRRACVDAKEALSTDVDAVVPVVLPGGTSTVRVTRAEFEALIRPALGETIATVRRTLRSAQIEASELAGVVLVGGSSRIPLVSELLQRELGVVAALDTHPKHDVALGALQTGLPPAVAGPARAREDTVRLPRRRARPPRGDAPAAGRRRRRTVLVAASALVAAALGLGAAALLGDRNVPTTLGAPTPMPVPGPVPTTTTAAPEPARVSLDGGRFTWPSGIELTMAVERSEPWTVAQELCEDGSCGDADVGDVRLVLSYSVIVPKTAEPFTSSACPGDLLPVKEGAAVPTAVPEFATDRVPRTIKPGTRRTGALEFVVDKDAADESFAIESRCGDTTGTGASAVFSGQVPEPRKPDRPGEVGDSRKRRYLDLRVGEVRTVDDTTFAALVRTCVHRELPEDRRSDDALRPRWVITTTNGEVRAKSGWDTLEPAFPFGRYRKGDCVGGWVGFTVSRGTTISSITYGDVFGEWATWRLRKADPSPPTTPRTTTPRRTTPVPNGPPTTGPSTPAPSVPDPGGATQTPG